MDVNNLIVVNLLYQTLIVDSRHKTMKVTTKYNSIEIHHFHIAVQAEYGGCANINFLINYYTLL